MDGIHDLGGRQGFGPVAVDEPEEPFHSDWEARLVGISRGMRYPPNFNIDRFRFTRELIDPVDYLVRPYYDQWLQVYAALMIQQGWITVEELAQGRALTPAPSADQPPPGPDSVAEAKKRNIAFDTPENRPPAFAVGDRVRTLDHGSVSHTRLPAFARAKQAEVVGYRGFHIYPDANVSGEKRGEPLYTVAIAHADLWPEAVGSRDRIFLDLWEPYLEPL